MPTESAGCSPARLGPEARPKLAGRLLRAVLGPADVSDADLIARFAATRDGDAFAELVRRHGPMVFGVCRRVTGYLQDAEDAFQAAFVVLARRAAHVREPGQLANWLYGVAYRTALEARSARRRVQEHRVSAAPEPAARPEPDDTADLRRVIDEELARLPDKYRSAVVLCDLEGFSRADAAVRLSIPEGTLSSRLAHARKVLAERLTRRGVTASAALVSATLGSEAVATVPRELVLLAARVARAGAAGAVPAGAASASVFTLADGVMKAMLVNRLRLTLGAVAALGLIGLGAIGLAQQPARTANNNPVDTPRVEFRLVDPATGEAVADQKPLAKPEKVAAKGIEDDDVPYGASPAQAVVRVEEGKLIVRQRAQHHVVAEKVTGQGARYGVYELKSVVTGKAYDPADVSVFDMKGNRLQTKAWKEKLKADVHALVAFDGKLPQPRELALFKDDTLLVVLPAAPATAYAPYATPLSEPAQTLPPAVAPRAVPTAPAVPGVPSYAVPSRSITPVPARPPANTIPPAGVPPITFPPGVEEVPAVVAPVGGS